MDDVGAVTDLGFNLLRNSRDKYRGQHCEHQNNASHGLFIPSFNPNVVRPGDSLRSLLDGCGQLGSSSGATLLLGSWGRRWVSGKITFPLRTSLRPALIGNFRTRSRTTGEPCSSRSVNTSPVFVTCAMKIRRSTTWPLAWVKGWTRKIRPSASISTSPSHRLGTSTVTGRPPVRSAIWLTTSCGKL